MLGTTERRCTQVKSVQIQSIQVLLDKNVNVKVLDNHKRLLLHSELWLANQKAELKLHGVYRK